MLMGFRHWDGQNQEKYYSISIPLIGLVVLCGISLTLLLPVLRWLLTMAGL
jgi:hypothetical protein